MEYGGDKEIKSKRQGRKAIHFAVQNGHKDDVILLINFNTDLKSVDLFGDFPLLLSVCSGNLDLFLLLFPFDPRWNVFILLFYFIILFIYLFNLIILF